MAKLFISHSSQDKSEAIQIMNWLESNGFQYLFLDSDARHGIKPGSEWEKVLYREIRQAHGFIFLLSNNWLNSQWCGFEYLRARELGKAIFPLRIQPQLNTNIAHDIQHLDLTESRDRSLQRLHAELTELTLSTHRGFDWDKNRSPYPGMMAFEAEDAPVFFGRDTDINRLRERLDSLRTQGCASLLVVLAASGAGKSSLIRAGLLPRLQRDNRRWIVLDAIRPDRYPLRKLAQELATAQGQAEQWPELYQSLQGEQALAALQKCLDTLKTQNQKWDATLLLSIDQAEELFSIAKVEEVTRLFQLLAQVQKENLQLLTLLTMRSDYLDALQNYVVLNVTNKLTYELFSLDNLPLAKVSELIHGPAQVVGLEVEEGLDTAVIQDAATEDALPLLAFALRELYERYGADGTLALDKYRSLGSEALNPLENAVQQKAREAIQPDQLQDEELKALRDAFIPHMVRVNEAGDYVRQPARWCDLPTQSHHLIHRLTHSRLLIQRQTNDEDNGDKYVEVAHEALLRHWRLLNDWLREEHDFLLGKQQLEHSLRDWQQLAGKHKEQDKALLQGIALERAHEWLLDDRSGLRKSEKNYIRKSYQIAELRRKKQRNRMIGFVSALILATVISAWLALSEQRQREQTEKALSEANTVIEFINFDLHDKLEPLGRLDIMDDIQKRVISYYNNLGNKIANEEFLRQRAVSLTQQADTLISQGKLSEAEELYIEANKFWEKKVDGNPNNIEWQHDLSVSIEKIGNTLSMKGQLEKAKVMFEQSQDILETLVKKVSSNVRYQSDLSLNLNRLGAILKQQGQLDEAKALFEQSHDIVKTLAVNDAGNIRWQRDLSISLDNIGGILNEKGQLEEAKRIFEKSLVITQKLSANDPENTHWQRDLSVSLNMIGDILVDQGNLEEAKALFEKSLVITETLVANDPSNVRWQRHHSINLERLGNTQKAEGNLDEAISSYQKSLVIIKQQIETDSNNTVWQEHLSITYNLIGDIFLAQGKIEEAKASFEESRDIAETLAPKDLSGTRWQHSFSVSLGKIGKIFHMQGQLKEARAAFEKNRDAIQVLVNKEPSNAWWQHELSVSFERLGDIQKMLGELEEALVNFEKSRVIRQTLVDNNPKNTEAQRDLAIILEHIGHVQKAKGNLSGAINAYQKSLKMVEPLTVINPSNRGLQRQLSTTYNLIGYILLTQKKIEEAKAAFEKSQAIRQVLAESDIANAGWQHDLAVSLSNIGDIFFMQGELKEAQGLFEKSHTIRKKLVENTPSNAGWQKGLVVSHFKIMEVAQQNGDNPTARRHGERAIRILNLLAEQDLLQGEQKQWIGAIEEMLEKLKK